jgi:hypothetical protein
VGAEGKLVVNNDAAAASKDETIVEVLASELARLREDAARIERTLAPLLRTRRGARERAVRTPEKTISAEARAAARERARRLGFVVKDSR